jgi:hypothetical protein
VVFERERDLLALLQLCALQTKYNPAWRTFTLTVLDEPATPFF